MHFLWPLCLYAHFCLFPRLGFRGLSTLFEHLVGQNNKSEHLFQEEKLHFFEKNMPEAEK